MEEKKLDFDAPFLSMRRIPTKPEDPSESENTEKKTKTTTRRRKVKDSCHETEHETLIRLLQDRSFDHVMEPSSVPFTWEQTPGKPKDQHTIIEELDLIKSLEMVSSTASFSANCSSNGVSEFENNGDGDRSSNVSRDDDVILEYRDLIMSRFLPAAEAIAMKEKKEAARVKEERKKKQNIALQRVSMAINQDLNNDNDDDDHNEDVDATIYSKDPKKAQLGFSPWLCSKNSMEVLNPVLSRIKTCQDIRVKSANIINPKPLDPVYKTKSASPRILKSNKVMSESQELYAKPRFSKEISKISLPKDGETLRIQGNLSRLQRSTDQNQRQEIRFLVEEVKRRSNINKSRAQNISIPQPPLPKTPSESWLCRAVPRSSAASYVVSGQAARFRKKMEEKTNSQSIKWETIVKRSYKHHDHVRYSEDLIIVHPSR